MGYNPICRYRYRCFVLRRWGTKNYVLMAVLLFFSQEIQDEDLTIIRKAVERCFSMP